MVTVNTAISTHAWGIKNKIVYGWWGDAEVQAEIADWEMQLLHITKAIGSRSAALAIRCAMWRLRKATR